MAHWLGTRVNWVHSGLEYITLLLSAHVFSAQLLVLARADDMILRGVRPR